MHIELKPGWRGWIMEAWPVMRHNVQVPRLDLGARVRMTGSFWRHSLEKGLLGCLARPSRDLPSMTDVLSPGAPKKEDDIAEDVIKPAGLSHQTGRRILTIHCPVRLTYTITVLSKRV
jgi:hypothetical protein